MEVKLTIDAGQLGDTVIDLFKNLSPEKKEQLTLDIMREWLKSPEFIETKNMEQLVIDEFRNGKRKPWGSYEKYDNTTPEKIIRADYKFKEAVEQYRTSKQIMVEELKQEIIKYYKKELSNQIKESDLINKGLNELYPELIKIFPELVIKSLIEVFAMQLTNLQGSIQQSLQDNMMNKCDITALQDKLHIFK
jgi:hypothetical protein